MNLDELIKRVEEDEEENIRGGFDGMWTELKTREMLPAIRQAARQRDALEYVLAELTQSRTDRPTIFDALDNEDRDDWAKPAIDMIHRALSNSSGL